MKFASEAFVTFESAWVYPNSFPSIVDSFMEVIGTAGHIHLDRKCESIEVSTNEKFTYPKGFLNAEIFGRLRGAFPSCLEDFLLAIREGTPPPVTAFDGPPASSFRPVSPRWCWRWRLMPRRQEVRLQSAQRTSLCDWAVPHSLRNPRRPQPPWRDW